MVIEILLAGLIGIAGSAIGFVVSGYFTLKSTDKQIDAQSDQLDKQITAETRRARADHYLQRKVEALMELFGVMVETRRVYKRNADRVGHDAFTQEGLEEAMEKFEQYHNTMYKASVFLEEDQRKSLLAVSDLLYKVNANFDQAIQDGQTTEMYDFVDLGLGEFNHRFDAAEDMLQEEVKTPIDTLEEETSVHG